MVRPYTIPEARFILSHVYCALCLPQDDGWTYQWAPGAGTPECCRCACTDTRDLRLYVATERKAREWIANETAAGCGVTIREGT